MHVVVQDAHEFHMIRLQWSIGTNGHFYATLDFQLRELNNRFSEQATQLLRFSSAFDPRYCCKSFIVEDIRALVKKFYPNNSID